jgi:alkylated DNA repair dioxygenase AlkB
VNLFQTDNLLPFDGFVQYMPNLLNSVSALNYFNQLLQNVEWHNDVVKLFGKEIITGRKTAWYGNRNFEYTYSQKTKIAIPWNKELVALKSLVEKRSSLEFNSCLLNLYHTGNEGMAWHSDDEKTIVQNSTIASLTLGADRRFLFKHKNTKQKIEIILQNGSLLLMKENTQENWLHCLPKSSRINSPRINLTFRIMKE